MGISEADFIAMQARLRKRKPCWNVSLENAAESGRERELHDKIREECHRRRWLVIHSRMDAPTTTARGVPDFIILANRSRIFFFECKTAKGKLTIDQLAFGIMAEQLGHKVHVVRSYSEFLSLIDV